MSRNVQYIEHFVLVVFIVLSIILGASLYRAKVINKAYWLWFYWNQGVTINEDSFYEDAKKWVHDPQYSPDAEVK